MSFRSAASDAKHCPICGKPMVPRFRPFCSKRCADIDLHRWLSASYTVPSDREPGGDDETP